MIKRYLSSVPVGLAMTLALLYAMHALIDSGVGAFTANAPKPLPQWRADIPKDDPPDTMDPPDRIDDPIEPPPLMPPTAAETGTEVVFVATPTEKPQPFDQFQRNLFTNSDGPLVHMVRVQPTYPPRAVAQGLEGFVTVRFDVSADGLATNVVVVESSSRLFEKAALNAAAKFRFKPKVVDGSPVPSTGITYRFRFEMDKHLI